MNGGGQGRPSIFDNIDSEDIIIAFFPCVYFQENNWLFFQGRASQQKNWELSKKVEWIRKRHGTLSYFYDLLCTFILICIKKKIKLVIENPATPPHYLTNYFIPATIIDKDRREDGDYYKKPTQYWFINFTPKHNFIFEPIEECEQLTILGIRSDNPLNCDRQVARSMIHPQYADRFIRRYIL